MFLRKLETIVIVLFVLSVSIYADITKEDAEDLVLNQILTDEIGNIDVYLSNDVINSPDVLQLWNDEFISCPYNSNWVFFVDDMVYANWYHPCRYIFVNTETGEYQIVNQSIYPENYENDFELIAEIPRPEPIYLPTNPDAVIESREPNEHLYAVIINGCDWERYWNDISAIYCTLIDVYGYTKENIIVHYVYGPGTSAFGDDLDGDEIHDDIDYAAYKNTGDNHIQSTFEYLEETLGPDDQLFVFIDDHGYGDYNGHSWVCLPGDDLHDYELAGFVENISCAQMIFVLEPCLVGGFIDDLSDYVTYNVKCENRVIHTACNDHESSWAELWITLAGYDEFVFYWTAAARGYYPGEYPWELGYSVLEFPFEDYFAYGPTHPDAYDPDLNGDGFVQMEEAFDYSNNFDTWSPYGYYNTSYPEGHIGHPHVGEEEHPDSFHNISFQEDLLSLYGICGNVENTQTISGNFMINPALTINPCISLRLSENTAIISHGILSIEDGVSFYCGEGSKIKVEEGGSFIAIGSGANSILFTSSGEEPWVGIELWEAEESHLRNCQIENAETGVLLWHSNNGKTAKIFLEQLRTY